MNRAMVRSSCIATALFVGGAWQVSQAIAADTSIPNDPFVAERNAIHAANQVYKRKAAAAQHDFDRVEGAADNELKKAIAVAKAERDKEVAKIKATH